MEQTCSECDFDASACAPGEVAAALPSLARAIADCVGVAAPEVVRRRPLPGVWSPIEYVGHLREAMAFHRWLIEKALAEPNPVIPQVDPDESVAQAGYASADCAELIGQFQRRVSRLCDQLSTLDAEAAARLLTLDGARLSVVMVARSAWHECHHHLGDIRNLTGPGDHPVQSPHA
jgi:hypothetical protein